jgi:DNA-binding NarL/FixJ family response regulator
MLPKIDGLSVIAALRKEFRNARLLVLSSYAGDARVSRAMAYGARAYALKTADVLSRGVRIC